LQTCFAFCGKHNVANALPVNLLRGLDKLGPEGGCAFHCGFEGIPDPCPNTGVSEEHPRREHKPMVAGMQLRSRDLHPAPKDLREAHTREEDLVLQ